MTRKDTVRDIWTKCFDDTREWMDMFFSKIYRDDEAHTLEVDGRTVSSLMMRPYTMDFHNTSLPTSYIYGAATLQPWRDKGCMTQLITQSLRKGYDAGDVLCTLIPNNEPLFKYYERMGFSPVFYINLERYTSAHVFSPEGSYTRIDDVDSDEVYELFDRLMSERPCAIHHSRQQWSEIVADNAVDGGAIVAIADEVGTPVAVAVTVPTDEGVKVADLLARDADSRLGALAMVRDIYGERPIEVLGYFNDPQGSATARGCARVVNALSLLEALAKAYPTLSMTLRLNDPLLLPNSHIYIIDRGTVLINDGFLGQLDYDIDVEVLASIIFGNDVTRRLLDFPAVRPFMSLMLD